MKLFNRDQFFRDFLFYMHDVLEDTGVPVDISMPPIVKNGKLFSITLQIKEIPPPTFEHVPYEQQ